MIVRCFRLYLRTIQFLHRDWKKNRTSEREGMKHTMSLRYGSVRCIVESKIHYLKGTYYYYLYHNCAFMIVPFFFPRIADGSGSQDQGKNLTIVDRPTSPRTTES